MVAYQGGVNADVGCCGWSVIVLGRAGNNIGAAGMKRLLRRLRKLTYLDLSRKFMIQYV